MSDDKLKKDFEIILDESESALKSIDTILEDSTNVDYKLISKEEKRVDIEKITKSFSDITNNLKDISSDFKEMISLFFSYNQKIFEIQSQVYLISKQLDIQIEKEKIRREYVVKSLEHVKNIIQAMIQKALNIDLVNSTEKEYEFAQMLITKAVEQNEKILNIIDKVINGEAYGR